MKHFFFLMLVMMIATFSKAQYTKFQKVYGFEGYNQGMRAYQTSDGGYFIMGNVGKQDNLTRILLLKVDSLGNYQWRTILGNNQDVFCGMDMKPTYNKGYIIAGFTSKNLDKGYDIYVVKIDSLGHINWQKTFGGRDWDFANAVIQTPDHGYALAGATYNNTLGQRDMFVLRLDVQGDSLWMKTYGGVGDDVANSIDTAYGGGYIMAGYTNSFGKGGFDGYIIRLNYKGDTLWKKTYGYSKDDKLNCIIRYSDSTYIAVGYSINPTEYSDFFVIRLKDNGDTLWIRKDFAADNKEANSVVKSIDGGFAFTGFTTGMGSSDVMFQKIFPTGAWQTSTQHGALYKKDVGNSIAQTKDGGYIIAGYGNGFSVGLESIYIIKTDPFGMTNATISIGIEEQIVVSSGKLIYPNPITNSSVIDLSSLKINSNEASVVISDCLGRIVFENKYSSKNRNVLFSQINLKSGIYIMHCYSDGAIVAVEKFIVE